MQFDLFSRRRFVKALAAGAAGLGFAPAAHVRSAGDDEDPLFKISLAEWSLVDLLRNGELDHLDFAETARSFGIEGLEYVNQFFMDRAEDTKYLREMKKRAEGEGVESLIIMCDNEGALGHPDAAERKQAVENHHKWVDAAKFLGCHSIRVNAISEGSFEEQQKLVADGLRRLTEFGAEREIDVIVENHGGYSSHAEWLVGVMEKVDHPRCGTLPDFGNFEIEEGEYYDSYQGVRELMPYAKGVSAKRRGYDAQGNRYEIDVPRMMKIVLNAGYRGSVGIEYSGKEGIQLAYDRLTAAREQLAPQYQ